MALRVRWLTLFASLMIIKTTVSDVKKSNSNARHSKSTHDLKKTKSYHKLTEQKKSIKKSGMAFEETSTERIKSRLDKSLGVLGPWSQNAGDLYMGGIGLKGQDGLLNQPIRPTLRINGYPINPRGSMSLTQLMDGTLDSDLDIQQIMQAQSRYQQTPANRQGNWIREMEPQVINMPGSRGMSQSMLDRMAFGNMVSGNKRGKMNLAGKSKMKQTKKKHLLSLRSSRGVTKRILGRSMLGNTFDNQNKQTNKQKHQT